MGFQWVAIRAFSLFWVYLFILVFKKFSEHFFKYSKTKVNIYGEAAAEKFYDGPFLFNCLIDRGDQEYPEDAEGIQFEQSINFYFLRDDLKAVKPGYPNGNIIEEVVPDVGDIILYQEGYYGVTSTVANQYWGGKNPSYPNNINPLNPGLENYGNNLSVLVSTYYIPADKVAISPYQERM